MLFGEQVKANRIASLEEESQERRAEFISDARAPYRPRLALLQPRFERFRFSADLRAYPACFSARSPITGSLNISPWFAFSSRMIQITRPANPTSGQIRIVRNPRNGM